LTIVLCTLQTAAEEHRLLVPTNYMIDTSSR